MIGPWGSLDRRKGSATQIYTKEKISRRVQRGVSEKGVGHKTGMRTQEPILN
jgi:hypothetical protein